MTSGHDAHEPSRPAADPGDIPHVLAPPPLIFLLPLVATLLVNVWKPWPLLSGIWPHLAGPALIATSLILLLSALRSFRAARTNPKPWKPTTALVIEGPYRITRNPMYVGFTLSYLAIALWVNSAWPLLVLPVVLPVMQWGVIRREERYLERKFGAAYRDYMRTVRRWL